MNRGPQPVTRLSLATLLSLVFLTGFLLPSLSANSSPPDSDRQNSTRTPVVAAKDQEEIELAPPPGVTVAGKVVRERDGRGVEGVDVWLRRVEPYLGHERTIPLDYTRTITDTSGGFTCRRIPPGRYRVQIREAPESYFTASVSPHQREAPFQVADRDITDLLVPLKQAGSVKGRVLLPSGEPAVGAEVCVLHLEGWYGYFPNEKEPTDEHGEFHIPRLGPAVNCRLLARLEGYGAAISERFDIRQGDSVEDMILSLQEPGTISGTIRNSNGEPVSEDYYVTFGLAHTSHAGVGGSALGKASPDESGGYRMSGLPPGDILVHLHVMVRCMDFGMGNHAGDGACTSPREAEVARVTSGKETTGIDFVVPAKKRRTGHIAGRVVTADGRGVGNAKVHAYTNLLVQLLASEEEGEHADTATDQEGYFAIGEIIEGTFTLSAYHPEYVRGQASDIESPSDNATIVLREFAGVEGRVIRAETGEPVPEFKIFYGTNEEWLQSKNVRNAQGSFHLEELVPETWLLRAEADGVGRTQTRIAVQEGEVKQVVLELRPENPLRGRVVQSPDMSPVHGAVVRSGTERIAVTGYDGRFAATGFYPGTITITIEHPAYGLQDFPGIEIPPEGDTGEIPFELKKPGKIEVHVSSPLGTPWEGAEIVLDGNWQASMLTGYDGSCVFPNLQPGAHTVDWRRGYLGTAESWKQTVGVQPGGTTVVKFSTVGTAVSGMVTESGKPKGFVPVTFSGPDTELRVQVDWAGRFEIFGLPPGIYTVTAKPPGGDTSWTERTVEVPAGEEIFLEFEKS
jgi:hypothetical protein